MTGEEAAVPIAGPGRLIHVDPTAAPGGDGSLENPYNSWFAFTLQAGDTALQRGGTVADGFTVTVQGTTDQPVTIGSYGTGQAQIQGSIVLSGASHVTVDNLDITGGDGQGVVLTNGTAACTIQACDIHGGEIGILVTDSCGHPNSIAGNSIYENDYVGIGFDRTVASPGAEITVTGNTIWRNGQQGIALHASHVVVDGNTVVNNGLSGLPGISAIHAYGNSAADPAGHFNTISNNIVAFQRDGSSPDGNGIMLDHWSGDTLVTGNQVFGNDGCGISLLSSSNNQVLDNTVHANMLDSGGTHVLAHAEIYLGETDLAPGVATGNTIAGNTIIADARYGAAVQVAASLTGAASNTITGNSLGQTGTGKLWIWGNDSGTALTAWNSLPRTGSDNDAGTLAIPPVTFDAATLDDSFTLHSSLLTSPNPTGMSMLVAHGATRDITGTPLGSWMAGDGRDNILTATGGNNLMSAGSGNATLLAGPGTDLLFGGAGNTLMIAGSGSALMIGGSGNSRMIGGAANDILYAGNGTGTKTLAGGGGENFLVGGDGSDTFVIGAGLDLVSAFTIGQDRLDVSRLQLAGFADLQILGDATGGILLDRDSTVRAFLIGTDVLQLSAANFIFAAPAAVATISLADVAVVLPEGNAGTTWVTLTVTRSGDLSRPDSAAWTVTGAGATPADATDFAGGVLPSGMVSFAPGEASRTISVAVAGDGDHEADEGFTVALTAPYDALAIGTATASVTITNDDLALACYATGTRIATPFGPRPVEALRPGDPVLTTDGAAHRVTWTGAWTANPTDPAHRGVRIRADALGPGRPSRDLVVSPEHALWLGDVLVPAIGLVDGVRVLREPARAGRYHHFALDHHAVVLAEDLPAETFCPLGSIRYDGAPTVTFPLPRLEAGVQLHRLRLRLGLASPAPGGGTLHGFLERVLPAEGGLIVEGWATDGPAPLGLRLLAGDHECHLLANAWRTDLDRAGLPAAGFRAFLPVPPDTPVTVLRRTDGAALARLA